MTRRFVFLLALLFMTQVQPVAGGATAADGSPDPASIDPVFDCFSANSAWGIAYSGKVLDRAGRIWSYSQRGRMLPALSDPGSTYDGGELRAKFAGATPGTQVADDAMAPNVALIDKAAAGTISSSDTGVRDAGTSTCHAYVADGARYRDIQLGSDSGVGDRRIVNDAAEAKTLLDWLRSIGVAK